MQITTRPGRLPALLLAGTLLALAGCGGGEAVTSASIARAKGLWQRAGIRDYDLEWQSSGASRAHYRVTVRGGVVRKVESVRPDGEAAVVHPAEPRFYGVEGLFMVIADELAQMGAAAPFGQPRGTTAVLRFTPDPELGYPRNYRRDVLGTPMALTIDVVRLARVTAPAPGPSP